MASFDGRLPFSGSLPWLRAMCVVVVTCICLQNKISSYSRKVCLLGEFEYFKIMNSGCCLEWIQPGPALLIFRRGSVHLTASVSRPDLWAVGPLAVGPWAARPMHTSGSQRTTCMISCHLFSVVLLLTWVLLTNHGPNYKKILRLSYDVIRS